MTKLEDFKQRYLMLALPFIQQQLGLQVENQVLVQQINQYRPKINWLQIDILLNKKQLSSGTTFSEKYFIDVIKPHFLRKRQEADYQMIYPEMIKLISIHLEYLKQSDQHYKEKRQKILNTIYEQFDLRNESIFAFKPTQDHLRCFFDRQFVKQVQENELIVFQPSSHSFNGGVPSIDSQSSSHLQSTFSVDEKQLTNNAFQNQEFEQVDNNDEQIQINQMYQQRHETIQMNNVQMNQQLDNLLLEKKNQQEIVDNKLNVELQHRNKKHLLDVSFKLSQNIKPQIEQKPQIKQKEIVDQEIPEQIKTKQIMPGLTLLLQNLFGKKQKPSSQELQLPINEILDDEQEFVEMIQQINKEDNVE